MNSYRSGRSYDNLERRIFDGVGEFGIPKLKLSTKEKKMVERVRSVWYNRNGK